MGKSTFKLHSMPRVGWDWCVLTFWWQGKSNNTPADIWDKALVLKTFNVPYVSARSQSEQCVGCREPHKFNNVGWRWTRLNKQSCDMWYILEISFRFGPYVVYLSGTTSGDLGKYVSRSNLPIKPLSVVNHNLRLTISYCMMHVSLAFWLDNGAIILHAQF